MIERSGEVASEPVRTTIVHGRWTGYRRLLQARLKELFREPEVIFWIFLFPILLALGLGLLDLLGAASRYDVYLFAFLL